MAESTLASHDMSQSAPYSLALQSVGLTHIEEIRAFVSPIWLSPSRSTLGNPRSSKHYSSEWAALSGKAGAAMVFCIKGREKMSGIEIEYTQGHLHSASIPYIPK